MIHWEFCYLIWLTGDTTVKDYTTGEPRKHHEFYLEDGSVVIQVASIECYLTRHNINSGQVEKAVFNIHRSLLARQSTVFREMFKLPQGNGSSGGTDIDPIILTDEVASWEALLKSLYRV